MSNEGEFDSIEIWLLSALSIFVSSDSHITCTNVAEHKRNYIWDVLNIGVVESRPLDFVWQTHSSHLYDFTQDGIYLSYKGQNRDVSRWHPCYFVFFVYVSVGILFRLYLQWEGFYGPLFTGKLNTSCTGECTTHKLLNIFGRTYISLPSRRIHFKGIVSWKCLLL